jgi:D-alanyl-D-alanine carboxypeptidase (penicillin-binding protein 5/6)
MLLRNHSNRQMIPQPDRNIRREHSGLEMNMNALTRRSFRYVLSILVFLLVVSQNMYAADPAYKSAILMDYETGRILFEENAHDQHIPASMVKMMVLFLTMEQLDAGVVDLSDDVTVSEWAAHMGGQQVHLFKGETFTLKELLDAMVIASANDAAVAVAEYIAGDVETCVHLMNSRAKAIGMHNTTFANVHGLPAGKGQVDDLTTAYDMAILGRTLVETYPEVLEWTSTYTTSFREGDDTMTLVNTNKDLLRKVDGIDGLKTGYHARSKFNVCATAERGDKRLIAVVMGAPSKDDRLQTVTRLLDLGFDELHQPTGPQQDVPARLSFGE